MGWQWHQLDNMLIICTLLQTDNNTSTSSLIFLQVECSSWRSTKQCQSIEGNAYSQISWKSAHNLFSYPANKQMTVKTVLMPTVERGNDNMPEE